MNKIKNIIKNNKKLIIISIILLIIINLISNTNYIISLFNKTEPIIYNKNDIIINNNEYIIKDINKDINLIEIKFDEIPESISISYTSDNFKNYEHFNQDYTKENNISDTLYILSSISGNVKNLKINITTGKIDTITINPNIKYKLNIAQSIIILGFILLVYYTIKHTEKINLKNFNQKYILILVITTLISLCVGFYLSYSKVSQFGNIYEKYYVDAIMNRKLELDLPISNNLLESDNPYDTSNRDFEYIWDASFYKGKYYCYFGIWPILSLFIPFKIITNHYLSTALGSLIYSILAIIGTYLIFKEIIKKYFKNISFQTYIISFLYIIFGSKLLWCMHRPSFYELTSIAAYTHIIFGLYLVLFSDSKVKNCIGYSLLALAVLCRPTALFASIIILPKIFNNIKKKKFKFKDFIILAIPYIIVGAFTMYINYIRFDSIFEFGISYQLTTNNLNNYKFSFINCIYGIYNYLFHKININLFPFSITGDVLKLPILGDFNIEPVGGGVITTSILGIIIIFIPKIFKYIKEKEVKIYITVSLIVAFLLMGFSSGIGALIGRYMLDFNYIFYFITVILCLYTINNIKNKKAINIYHIIAIISIILNLFLSSTI